jgi:polyribonucleotide nucleotidyltransferase
MKIALKQAHDGRKHILGEMAKALTQSRATVSETAPKMQQLKIHTDKIREVIGTGGKVIREIVEVSGAKVDIDDEGMIKVSAVEQSAIDKAMEMIHGIVDEPEVGKIYTGKVAKIVDFGAFVTFMPNRDGLVHISEIMNERVAKVSDHINEGDEIYVKLIGVDDRGKTKLSMKRVDQETGEDLEASDIDDEDDAATA